MLYLMSLLPELFTILFFHSFLFFLFSRSLLRLFSILIFFTSLFFSFLNYLFFSFLCHNLPFTRPFARSVSEVVYLSNCINFSPNGQATRLPRVGKRDGRWLVHECALSNWEHQWWRLWLNKVVHLDFHHFIHKSTFLFVFPVFTLFSTQYHSYRHFWFCIFLPCQTSSCF